MNRLVNRRALCSRSNLNFLVIYFLDTKLINLVTFYDAEVEEVEASLISI